MSYPQHSIDTCPVCGGGLLGIRICTGQNQIAGTGRNPDGDTFGAGIFEPTHVHGPHGLIVCDECEAIWIEPHSSAPHIYPSADDARCPVCDSNLWNDSHWATAKEVESIGWAYAVNTELDWVDDSEIA
jgi:hypothetical protein